MKKSAERVISYCILAARVPVFRNPVSISVTWYEPDNRRDPDNVQAAIKFILDALKKSGRIPNDTRRYIRDIRHKVLTDKKDPRVVVTLLDTNHVSQPG